MATTPQLKTYSPVISRQLRPWVGGATFTLFVFLILSMYLSPFVYMTFTSLKDRKQFSNIQAALWPAQEGTYTYEGKDYPLVKIPDENGAIRNWALVKKGRQESLFIDPQNPEAGLIPWQGSWRTLESVWQFAPRWENYFEVNELINLPLLLFNTFAIALIGVVGTLASCVMVAYGFARFRIPGKNILFLILIGTIVLPYYVTMVPTYALFTYIGWTGTWLPLIVPHFFANAYNVFLLRQFFMTIPREMDEAAMIDGAGPFRTLISVILPQAVPAVVAVSIFHFIFAWNDFLGPLVYLSTRPDLQPISIGVQRFNALYAQNPPYIQATSMLGLLLPVIIFFIAQRVFLQGVVISGVEK